MYVFQKMDSMIVFCQQVESTGHGYCDTQYRGYSSRRNEEQRDTHQPNHHSSYEGTKDSQGFVLAPFISHELTKSNIFVLSLMILDSTVRLISLELYNVKPGKSVPQKNSENINTDFCTYTVLKLLKMAKGIRALLDTVMQALPQVGNLGLLFFLLFFIFAALGVELFGRLGEWFLNVKELEPD